MPISVSASGSVDNADLQSLIIDRDPDTGELAGRVTYQVTTFGETELREAAWSLSVAEKTAIANLLAGAKAAISADVGL